MLKELLIAVAQGLVENKDAVQVTVDAASATAKSKIEAAGGSVTTA